MRRSRRFRSPRPRARPTAIWPRWRRRRLTRRAFSKRAASSTKRIISTAIPTSRPNVDPFEHFFLHGFKEGRKPNIVFDTRWYLETYGDVREAGVNCLLHYALLGEEEDGDPTRYSKLSGIASATGSGKATARAALPQSPQEGVSPIRSSTPTTICRPTRTSRPRADPFEHYMIQGFTEGRNPSPDFDAKFYVRRYLGGDYSRNPLLHYLSLADRNGILTKPSESDQTIPNLVKKFTRPGDDYEELRPLPRAAARKAKVLAYYLTQFHPIAENDSGGAKASRNGPTSRAACRGSRTTTSRGFRATSASTICSIST